MISFSALSPAEKLEGRVLKNGWTVLSIVNKKPGATGGFFSVGYTARHDDGRIAFLKALDWSAVFQSADPPREIQRETETFNFERDLLAKCKGLDRIVTALDDDTILIDGLPVPYLIFELATGDIRGHMDLSANLDLAWTLRMLHNAAVGIKQLHSKGITHQDLKPSNVLVFSNLVSKLADLGRSGHPDYHPPHDHLVFAGDTAYAPPEVRYSYQDPNIQRRRMYADAFLLGNIILFAFTRLNIPSVISSFLAPEHQPLVWKGTYQEVLPYVQSAFNDALGAIEQYIPEQVRTDIMLILRQLCEPDPEKRGRTINRSNFSLEKYVTKLDVLAYKAERNLFK